MNISIESKFNIGEYIYSIERDAKYPVCERCNGNGVLELVVGGSVTCDECHGTKLNESEHLEITFWKPTEKIKITEVSALSDGDKVTIGYFGYFKSGGSEVGFDEIYAFSTLEEAEKECERRGEKLTDEL